MLTDWELWAVANKVLDQHGENVGAFLQERIETLGEQDDTEGVATWLAIIQHVRKLVKIGPDEARN